MATTDGECRTLVLNPTSGSADHVDRVRALAREHDFDVRPTESAGHGTELARDAADAGADLVAAAGGDGTVNEVVNGLVRAEALEDTALGVVPAGTGNNFATNVGIDGLEHAFEVIESGERREIDLGVTNERAFVNSCVSGVTAEASGETSSDGKRQFGVLAYVVNTLERMADYDPIPMRIEVAGEDGDGGAAWEGDAVFVLVGNGRRFTTARAAQADVEDGLFEVTVVEEAPASDLVGEAAVEGLLGGDGEHIVRRRTPSLAVEHRDGDPVEYSLDGEMLEAESLALETRASALSIPVGEAYEPDPDANESGFTPLG